MGVDRKLLDAVMSELVAVSRSATSKREEAANLALIWNGRQDEVRSGRHRRDADTGDTGDTGDTDRAATA